MRIEKENVTKIKQFDQRKLNPGVGWQKLLIRVVLKK